MTQIKKPALKKAPATAIIAVLFIAAAAVSCDNGEVPPGGQGGAITVHNEEDLLSALADPALSVIKFEVPSAGFPTQPIEVPGSKTLYFIVEDEETQGNEAVFTYSAPLKADGGALIVPAPAA